MAGGCCDAPSSSWVRHLALFSLLLHCLSFPSFLLPTVCVCCHSIVGLGLCHCGMAVCAGTFPRLSSSLSLFLFVLVFGVVRAQPCEHARYPRTPLCSPCCVLSLSAPRLSSYPAFSVIVEWRWGIHHVSVCCVGMTAIGSLSLSSSFF